MSKRIPLQAETNYSDSPLVTVNLACYSGDVKYVKRAVVSLANQDLPHKEIQVLPIFDGDPTPPEEALIAEAFEDHDFHSVFLIGTGQKSGYYTLGRNQALEYPYNFGHYQTNLDADNEYAPNHLSGLLEAIRIPDPDGGWPHFVYSRREFIFDEGVEDDKLPSGQSKLIEWTPENCHKLTLSPKNNFVDTGDFLIGKGALYELAEKTGCVWNPNMRRFGDWDLVKRLAEAGLRGRAVDQVTNYYHWTGANLQTERKLSEITAIPADMYETLKAKGAFRE